MLLPIYMLVQLNIKPALDSLVFCYEIKDATMHFKEAYSIKQGNLQIKEIGHWSTSEGLAWNTAEMLERRRDLQGTKLVIGTSVYMPFIDFPNKWDYKNLSLAEGYVFDILAEMQARYNFQIEFVRSRDWQFGTRTNGTWNGFVRMLLVGDIDLVATGFTMTQERMEGNSHHVSETK